MLFDLVCGQTLPIRAGEILVRWRTKEVHNFTFEVQSVVFRSRVGWRTIVVRFAGPFTYKLSQIRSLKLPRSDYRVAAVGLQRFFAEL